MGFSDRQVFYFSLIYSVKIVINLPGIDKQFLIFSGQNNYIHHFAAGVDCARMQ